MGNVRGQHSIQKPQPFAGHSLHTSGLQFGLTAYVGRSNLRYPFEYELDFGLFFIQCCRTKWFQEKFLYFSFL